MNYANITIAINPSVTVKKVGEEWYVLEENRHYLRQLNDTAGDIMACLSKPATVHEIVDHLTKTYEVTKEEAQKDVEDFIAEYAKAGIVTCLPLKS